MNTNLTAAMFAPEDAAAMVVIMVISLAFVGFIIWKFRRPGISHADNLHIGSEAWGMFADSQPVKVK